MNSWLSNCLFIYLFIVAESKSIRGERVGQVCERRMWRSFLLWTNMVMAPVTWVLDVVTQTRPWIEEAPLHALLLTFYNFKGSDCFHSLVYKYRIDILVCTIPSNTCRKELEWKWLKAYISFILGVWLLHLCYIHFWQYMYY